MPPEGSSLLKPSEHLSCVMVQIPSLHPIRDAPTYTYPPGDVPDPVGAGGPGARGPVGVHVHGGAEEVGSGHSTSTSCLRFGR